MTALPQPPDFDGQPGVQALAITVVRKKMTKDVRFPVANPELW